MKCNECGKEFSCNSELIGCNVKSCACKICYFKSKSDSLKEKLYTLKACGTPIIWKNLIDII